MAFNLKNRSFLTLRDYTPAEIGFLLKLAADLKAAKYAGSEQPMLRGREIALIFEKDSTRTRVGFEVAAHDQGAHVTYLGPSGSHIGHKESIKDTARVLGRVYDAIEYRGFGQSVVETLAKWSGVPVYNGLTDQFHPTQILADLLTMREHCEKPLREIAFCFLGDTGNNMGDSLLIGGAKMGMDVRLCGPKSLWPAPEIIAEAEALAHQTGARVLVTDDVVAGVRGCDFLYTDVWVSMGQPDTLWAERIKLLQPYQVNTRLMHAAGNARVRFMHCLPAFHDTETEVGAQMAKAHGISAMEVTDEVFESPASIVFDQAENRMHTIKAVLVATLGGYAIRVVVALGGNALLRRGEPVTAEAQRANIRRAAAALARLLHQGHQLIITHGNGPQVGLLALQGAQPGAAAFPLDVLGAETEGMIGYVLEQELNNAYATQARFATLLTQIEVDPDDPAFAHPTKPVGAVYTKPEAERLSSVRGWTIAPDGDGWRRVVASPRPQRILEIEVIRLLVDQGVVVICAGGGGIPVAQRADGCFVGIEAVIDKDYASGLLATALKADAFLMLTDVDGVYTGWGTAAQRAIGDIAAQALMAMDFAAGSMGPKVEAACAFVAQTGGMAGIGALEDAAEILARKAGTRVLRDPQIAG